MTKKFVPSPAQSDYFGWVEHGSGNAILEAVAGAGKTTTIVRGLDFMSGNIALLAFNKKMGDELQERTRHLKNVRAGTFHSFGFSTYRYAMNKRFRVNVDGNKVKIIARDLTHDTKFESWVPAICQLVSLAKQVGFKIKGLGHEYPTLHDWLGLIDYHDIMDKLSEGSSPDRLAEFAAQALDWSNEDLESIDFDDMIYLPLFLNLRFFRQDWVIVDEAQDTNPVRREMARRMMTHNGRFVAVGDPHQAIFGFTGADNDSLDLIRDRFEAITLPLTITYRCPKTVVSLAQQYVSHIEAASTAPIGEHLNMTSVEMLKFVEPGDAILCRLNRPLVSMCFKLIREGRPAKIEGRSIGDGLASLAGRWKTNSLEVLTDRLNTWAGREIDKAKAKDDDARIERIEDQHGTMMVLIEKADEQGVTTVDGLKEMIRSMFEDVDGNNKSRLIVLSSVHRSKGLEWDRVFILDREQLMPSPRANKSWEMEQENNLIYVALTRSQDTLVDVTTIKED